MFEWVQLQRVGHGDCRSFSIGDDIRILFGLRARSDYIGERVKLAIELRSSDGLPVANMIDVDSGFQIEGLQKRQVVSVTLSDVRLYPDTYSISLWAGSITSTERFDYVTECVSFEIVDGGALTSRRLPRSAGVLFLTPTWRTHNYGRKPAPLE